METSCCGGCFCSFFGDLAADLAVEEEEEEEDEGKEEAFLGSSELLSIAATEEEDLGAGLLGTAAVGLSEEKPRQSK